MNDDPVSSFIRFMSGRIPDQLSLGGGLRWFIVGLYWALLIGAFAVAFVNWRRDPAQRTAHHATVFLTRVVLAGMWWVGSLWKMPWLVTPGFQDWLGQTVKYSSYPSVHGAIMQVFLDHIPIVDPLVSLLEIALAASLMLGFMVRVTGIVGALFIFNLLIGLFNAPTEWVWTYVGLICSQVMFSTSKAGLSLGLDNLIARCVPLRHPLLRWAFSVMD